MASSVQRSRPDLARYETAYSCNHAAIGRCTSAKVLFVIRVTCLHGRVQGNINLIEAAARSGVKRFVLVTSIGTGDSKDAPPAQACSQVMGRGSEGACKRLREKCASLLSTCTVCVCMLRSRALHSCWC